MPRWFGKFLTHFVNSIMLLVKFWTSANQEHSIWSREESFMQPVTSSPWGRGHRWSNYDSSLMLEKWIFETFFENMLQEETNGKLIVKVNATPLVNDIVNKLVLLETLGIFASCFNERNFLAKFNWKVLLTHQNNTGTISEFMHNCSKWVVNFTNWQIVFQSLLCYWYVASMCSRQLLIALYSMQLSHCFVRYFH